MLINGKTRRIAQEAGRGVALVVVLCAVVLLSALVLAFLSRSVFVRQLSFSSAGLGRSDILAKSALDLVVADLQDEMAAGSSVTTANGVKIFSPASRVTVMPCSTVSPTLPTLVKTSAPGTNFWYGPTASYSRSGPIRSAPNNDTATPSLNGRYIDKARWMKPALLANSDGFATPGWAIITRGGPLADATSLPPLKTLADRSEGNLNLVLGRYAYAIYDEGGLLDINVAGNALSTSQNAQRGRLHQADLSAIPGIVDPAALVDWRNPVTKSDLIHLFDSTNDFRSVYPGNQAFVNRQDLIKYVADHPEVISTDALPYLTDFTREKNAPSWGPLANAPAKNYLDNSNLPTSLNRFLPNVRVTAPFTRRDGTVAKIGEPYIKRRFALSALALLTLTASDPGTGPIYKAFGLTRSNASMPWSYNHGGPAGQICTLAQAAALGREADFFELLQAGILSGSLGKSGGTTAAYTDLPDLNTYHQTMRIGASIIDQFDEDSIPTTITFNGDDVYGIENLPYIDEIFVKTYSAPSSTICQGHLVFEWWNPHLGSPGGIGPSAVRARATNGTIQLRFLGDSAVASPPYVLDPTATVEVPSSDFSLYQQPRVPNSGVGFQTALGYNTIPLNSITRKPVNYLLTVPASVMIVQEYKDSAGWHIYGTYAGLASFPLTTGIQNTGSFPAPICYSNEQVTQFEDNNSAVNSFVKSDPRTFRFGCSFSYRPFGGGASTDASIVGKLNSSNRPHKGIASNPGLGLGYCGPRMKANWDTSNGYVGLLVENSFTGSSYTDPDGVTRRGDGFILGSSAGVTGLNPMESSSTATPEDIASRPLILNRPFRSVGEMGYAFRDTPWKTLDFNTPESADAGLLDLFSVDDCDVVAGRVNLNTRQVPVLQAMLSGTAQDSGTTLLGNTLDIANQLVAGMGQNAQGPIQNKSELVSRVMSASGMNAVLPFLAQRVKSQRESVVRSVADVGTTRTWNLLIDVFAQAGRYTPTSKNLDEFVVEGEKRYWLHIAIDRYTGEIVDRELEVVNE